MRGKDMVAIGRIVLAKRERVIMLQPWDRGLLGTTLRYTYEVRDQSLYFDHLPDIKVPKDMMQPAEHILDSKAADFDPSQFQDRYEDAVVAMIKSKQAGMPQATAKPPIGRSNVIDLMDALRRSLGTAPKAAPASKAKKPRKRIAGQGEMLLRISGKGPAKETTITRAFERTHSVSHVAGVKLYGQHCAICHGTAAGTASASPVAKGEYPRPPQLAADGVEDDADGVTYWKIKHGIRLTGMPSWKDSLTDQQIWTVALFLKHMDKLPPGAQADWNEVRN